MRNLAFVLLAMIPLGAVAQSQPIYKKIGSNGIVSYTDDIRQKTGFKLFITVDHSAKFHSSIGHFSPSSLKYSSANKEKYSSLIDQVANENGVDPHLAHAVVQVESGYNAGAISSAGAVGLMQLMPETAHRFGVSSRTNPEENVLGGIRYLKLLLELFNNNLKLAVAAYNAGEGAVMKYHYNIPPYQETQDYVRKVLALYHAKKYG